MAETDQLPAAATVAAEQRASFASRAGDCCSAVDDG